MATVKKIICEKDFDKPINTNGHGKYDSDPVFLKQLDNAKKVLSKVKFPEQVKK